MRRCLGEMPFGYVGKVLRVDLTAKRLEVEEPAEEFYRTYMGGRTASVAITFLER